MKQKLREHLDRIEQALKELTKEVRALRPTHEHIPNGDDEHDEEGDPIPLDKPKEVVKAVKAALGKTRKRSKK
jgi:hypothetical protein